MNSKCRNNILLFLLCQTLSLFGTLTVGYTIIWYITLETSSTAMVTISILCTYVPQIVISMVTGVWVDKYSKKTLIIVGNAITAVVTLIIFIILLFGNKSLIIIFIACALRAVGSGIQTPAENAFIPMICSKKELSRVNGLNSTCVSIMTLLSPGLGGLFLSFFGFTPTLLIDVVATIIAIILLFFLKVESTTESQEKLDVNMFHGFIDGLKYFKNHFILGKLLVFYLMLYFFLSAPAFLTPVLVERSYGADIWRFTANEFLWALGNVFGGILMFTWGGFKNRLLTMAYSSVMFGFNIILLGVTSNFGLYLLFMTFSGVFLPIFTTANTVLIQENVKDVMLGRVFSNIQILSTVATTLGILIFGSLGDFVSIKLLLIITGSCIGIISFFIFHTHKISKKYNL